MSIAEKLTTVAENVPKVYEAGKNAEWDEFWDAYQTEGNRTRYDYAFGGLGWTDKNFKPKYDIRPTRLINGFYQTQITDLEGILEKQNTDFDTSQCTQFQYTFSHSKLTRIPEINITSATNINNMFTTASSLVSIRKLVINENNVFAISLFQNCSNLEHIIIEGTIGQNNFDIHWSKNLSGESIVSIIEALSSITSGLTVTLSKTAVNNMIFPITSIQTNNIYDSWATLIATKSNWTISLV